MGEIKQLGSDRYQIGRIVVDKRAGSFTVPGRVHVTGKPLEYLATSPGGAKEYETLLELDTTGSEFNLACILIGLERDAKQVSARDQSPHAPLVGQRVAIFVAWAEGGKQRRVSAAQALLNADAGVKAESVEWVYTGSYTAQGTGRFAADDTGTLVGFIPDENCVIQSAVGIGIGAYGSVRGHATLPPVGSAIELVVEAVKAAR
ncbi:MAG: YdjY domain-containing protein [Rubrivivax sp.]|nr:YdjY domain-containing protein [Rubrivivax sp.]